MSVDMDYIQRWLNEFAELIDDRDVIGILSNAIEKASARKLGTEPFSGLYLRENRRHFLQR